MNQINVNRLRRELFDSNKIPKDAEGRFPQRKLYDRFGNVVCECTVIVTKQLKPLPPKERFGQMITQHASGHRLYVLCPHCVEKIPVGRLAQHCKYKHSDAAK